MLETLFIGKKRVDLTEVNSTNTFMKEWIKNSKSEAEGLVVTAKNQLKGRGQSGNNWISQANKNLTLSVYLKPNILASNQFLISKLVALGIIDFLNHLELKDVLIKWPNDIFCNQRKIAGILIENILKESKIDSSVVGIGLNVNQLKFDTDNNPTSIFNELGSEQKLEALLGQLLFFVEKRYISLKQGKEKKIDTDYLNALLGLNEVRNFKINGSVCQGEIKGVNAIGQLQVLVHNQLKTFNTIVTFFLAS